MKFFKLSVVVVAVLFGAGVAFAGTLDEVKARGYIQAGVNGDVFGFSMPNDKGVWKGIDVDTARAIAVAVFGDANKVKFSALTAVQRLPALQSKEIDVLCRNTTQTLTRSTTNGLNFAHVNYYDGQGFMVRKDLGVVSALELGGAAICTNTGTTTELNVADYFRSNNMEYTVVAFEKADEVVAAYDAGRCDVYTTDQSGIAAQRTKLADPNAHIILPEIISKEPLGPLVRHGDNRWGDIAMWSLNCMINSEEMGITSANVDEMAKSDNPAIQRQLGASGDLGELLGIPNNFCHKIIAQVGNYGESFERNVGPDTPLGLERGLNAPWYEGGLLYAPPAR